jgi:hypothetical protein
MKERYRKIFGAKKMKQQKAVENIIIRTAVIITNNQQMKEEGLDVYC